MAAIKFITCDWWDTCEPKYTRYAVKLIII